MYNRLLFIGHVYGKDVFTVGLDHHFHSTTGEIVKYNFIIANSNTNVYNPSSGKFTAAFDGTYIFHYYGLAPKNQVLFQVKTNPTFISCK